MKIMFLSDIHGDKACLSEALEVFEKEGADVLALLGDALYHGPRNPLPSAYDPAAVAEMLNGYKDKIIAVRGNCDSEVDQMLIAYPMLADYTIIFEEGRRFFLSHGHIFSPDKLPCLSRGDVFVSGHTHIPLAEENNEGIYILNPGSVTLPKQNYARSYGLCENGRFEVKDFSGNVIKSINF